MDDTIHSKMAELIASNLENIAIKNPSKTPNLDTPLNLAQLERNAIKKALDLVDNEISKTDKAAKILGISRATLYRKIKEYNL